MTEDDIRRLRREGTIDQIHAAALETLSPLYDAFRAGNTDAFVEAATNMSVEAFRAGYRHAIEDVIDLQRKRADRGYDTIDPRDGGRNDR